MASNPYSLVRARVSLLHFLAGRGACSLLGVGIFVLTVRLLSRNDYGIFIAAVALVEIYYLVSNFGLSTVAQRYVADARITRSTPVLSHFVWNTIELRLTLSVATVIPIYLYANTFLGLFDLHLDPRDTYLLIALFVFGALSRHLDEVLAALLLQGTIQIINLVRNFLKLAYLAVAAVTHMPIGLTNVLALELATTALATLMALIFFGWQFGFWPKVTPADRYRHDMMWSVSWKYYFIQILAQTYSPNTFKLVSNRILGLAATASLGFAQSIIDMIQNYLPSRLLLSWIRPLMISRYMHSRNIEDLSIVSSAIFKLSFITLLPFSVFFTIHGDEFSALVSHDKYTDQQWLLLFLTLYCLLLTLHLIIQLVTLAIEQVDGNVFATVFACLSIPISILCALRFGLNGLVIGMILSELIWNSYAIWHLRRGGVGFSLDLAGLARLAAVGVLSASGLLPFWRPEPSVASTIIAFGLACLAVGFLAWTLKPFRPAERDLIGKFMPLRYFPW